LLIPALGETKWVQFVVWEVKDGVDGLTTEKDQEIPER
jgi:hypothetical protein